jgi:hypothetical protein
MSTSLTCARPSNSGFTMRQLAARRRDSRWGVAYAGAALRLGAQRCISPRGVALRLHSRRCSSRHGIATKERQGVRSDWKVVRFVERGEVKWREVRWARVCVREERWGVRGRSQKMRCVDEISRSREQQWETPCKSLSRTSPEPGPQ